MAQSGFNPKARWDRHIPEDADDNPNFLNQKIEALAWFKGSKVYPRIFVWKNKKYKIKKITYSWQERHGQELITYFSVDTGTNLYQISLNNITFVWKLDKIIE